MNLLSDLSKFSFFFSSILWKWPFKNEQKYIFLASCGQTSFRLFSPFFLPFATKDVWSALGLLDNDAANCDSIGRFSQLKPDRKYIRWKQKEKKGGNGMRFLERQTRRQGFLTRLLSDGARPGCVSVRAIESLPAINRNFRAKRKKRVAWALCNDCRNAICPSRFAAQLLCFQRCCFGRLVFYLGYSAGGYNNLKM